MNASWFELTITQVTKNGFGDVPILIMPHRLQVRFRFATPKVADTTTAAQQTNKKTTF
jgi:hypothetical protein